MSDKIQLDIDIINMRFKYSDTDTVSDIRTRIRTDLNPSKRIRFRIRSENICTVFIPNCAALHTQTLLTPDETVELAPVTSLSQARHASAHVRLDRSRSKRPPLERKWTDRSAQRFCNCTVRLCTVHESTAFRTSAPPRAVTMARMGDRGPRCAWATTTGAGPGFRRFHRSG